MLEVVGLAGVLAVVGVAFGHLVFGRPFADYDITTYSLPYRVQIADALRRGHLPLWDPLRLGGVPLLANPQAAVLYPPHWLLLPFRADRAQSVSTVLHVAVAGAGTALFATRSLRTTAAAGAVAGAAFGVGGFVHGHIGHFEQITSLAWVPWALLATDAALGAPTHRAAARAVVAVAGLTALIGLAGHTQYLHMGIIAVGVYAAAVGRPPGRILRPLAGLALGLLLAAPQLLPSYLIARRSVRADGIPYLAAAEYSLPWNRLAGSITPPYFTAPPLPVEFWAWIPVTIAVLAALGLWAGRREHRVRALVVLSVLGILMALGSNAPVYRLAYDVVPGVDRFRAPARWLLLPALAVPLLAALGFDRLLASARKRSKRWLGATVVIVAGLAIGELLVGNLRTPVRSARMDAGALLRPTAVTQLVPAWAGRVLSLGSEGVFQFAAQRDVLRPNTHVFDGIRSIDGYDGGLLYTRDWARGMVALTGDTSLEAGDSLRNHVHGPLDVDRFLELDVTRVLDRQSGLDLSRVLPEGSALIGQVGDVAVWRTPSLGPVFVAGGAVPDGLRLTRDPLRPERLVVDVPPSAAGRRVVVSEAFDPGWTASGGIRLTRHHDFLMAFEAPTGGGRVVLEYHAPGLRAGIAIAALGLATAGFLAWLPRRLDRAGRR